MSCLYSDFPQLGIYLAKIQQKLRLRSEGILIDLNLLMIYFTSISQLLQQRQKDLEFRSEIFERIQKLESEKNILNQNLERMINQKKNAENEKNVLQARLSNLEKTFKEEKFISLFESDLIILKREIGARKGRIKQISSKSPKPRCAIST